MAVLFVSACPVAFRLGSVAVRPAVPARRLPFLPGVLCKGCPLLPCRSVGVPHLVGVSFGVGVRLGSVSVPSVSCLGRRLPLPPFFPGFSPLLFFFPPLTPYYFINTLFPNPSPYYIYNIIYKNNNI